MFYGFLTLILNIFTLKFFLSDFYNTPLLKYPLFKKVKISRNYSFKPPFSCYWYMTYFLFVKTKTLENFPFRRRFSEVENGLYLFTKKDYIPLFMLSFLSSRERMTKVILVSCLDRIKSKRNRHDIDITEYGPLNKNLFKVYYIYILSKDARMLFNGCSSILLTT